MKAQLQVRAVRTAAAKRQVTGYSWGGVGTFSTEMDGGQEWPPWEGDI